MKNTIRFSAALLALGMLFSAAGCAGTNSSSAASESSAASSAHISGSSAEAEAEPETAASAVMGSVVTTSSDVSAASSDAAVSAAESGTVSQSGDAADTFSASAEAPADAFDAGMSTSSVYRNSYFGIRFRLPKDWSFAEEPQLAEMNKAVSDKDSAEEIRSALSEGQTWFDMYATSDDGYQNLNITVQNIKAVYGANADIDTLVDTSLAPLRSALEAQGAQDISVRKETTDFSDEPAVCTRIEGSVQGIPFYETQVYMKEGSYILCATAVSYSEDQTDSILEGIRRI